MAVPLTPTRPIRAFVAATIPTSIPMATTLWIVKTAARLIPPRPILVSVAVLCPMWIRISTARPIAMMAARLILSRPSLVIVAAALQKERAVQCAPDGNEMAGSAKMTTSVFRATVVRNVAGPD